MIAIEEADNSWFLNTFVGTRNKKSFTGQWLLHRVHNYDLAYRGSIIW